MYIYKIEQIEERMIKYSWFFLFRNKNRGWGHLYDIHIYMTYTFTWQRSLRKKPIFHIDSWCGRETHSFHRRCARNSVETAPGIPIILILFSIEIHRNVHSLKCARIHFSPNRICPYMNRIIDSALIWENRGQRTVFLHILCSDFLGIG